MRCYPILLLIAPFLSIGQNDTIFTITKKVIPCDIIWVKGDRIKYRPFYDWSKKIPLTQVVFYSVNGNRQLGRGQQEGLPRIDTAMKTKPVANVIKRDTVTLEEDIAFMQYCFRRSQKEGKIGVGTIVLGTSFTTYGSFRGDQYAMLIGGIATLVGLVIVWDSYKWMDRAGLGVSRNANGLGVRYRFE